MLLSPGLLIFSSINITDSFKNPLVTLSNTWNPNTAQIHFGQIVHKNEQLPPDMAQATNELLQPAAVEIGPWHPPGLAALTTSIVAWPRQEAAEPEVGVLIALLEWRAGMGCREFTKDFSCSFCWRFFVFLEAEALETMKHNETESWGRFDTHVMFAQECWPHCLHHQWSSSSLPAFVSPLRAGVWRISHQLALVDTSHTNGAGNFSCPVSFRDHTISILVLNLEAKPLLSRRSTPLPWSCSSSGLIKPTFPGDKLDSINEVFQVSLVGCQFPFINHFCQLLLRWSWWHGI